MTLKGVVDAVTDVVRLWTKIRTAPSTVTIT